jgi:ABC-type transporter Mla MlaB component
VLRISRVTSPDATVTLRLAGQVRGPWVEELRRVCDQVLATAHALSLDLTEVSFLDRQGVALCHCLRARNVGLLHSSPFVAEQLKEEGL